MKPFFIALRLWLGTIFTTTLLIFLWGILNLEAEIFLGAFVVLIGGGAITCPLLLPTTLLVRATCLLPYSASSRIAWLGFAITLQNWGYIQLIGWATMGKPIWENDIITLFALLTVCLFVVIFFTRNSFRKLYSQQTEVGIPIDHNKKHL